MTDHQAYSVHLAKKNQMTALCVHNIVSQFKHTPNKAPSLALDMQKACMSTKFSRHFHF